MLTKRYSDKLAIISTMNTLTPHNIIEKERANAQQTLASVTHLGDEEGFY